MKQELSLYHGSIFEGLDRILANSHSHVNEEDVAFFTTDRVYALICCRSRKENFVTMGLRNGVLHYYERFSDQLQVMYQGRKGYLYAPIHLNDLINTTGHTWECTHEVPVKMVEMIQDIYPEILKEEKSGNVIIHRYDEIDPSEQIMHANYIREHLDDPIYAECREFFVKNFNLLSDNKD